MKVESRKKVERLISRGCAALILISAVSFPLSAFSQISFSRINSLPVRNTPVATDSIPASDAAGTTYRIPFDKFTGGGVGGGTGDALTSNSLGQFAATTSLELKAVLSDELGDPSGKVIFSLGTLNIALGKSLTVNNNIILASENLGVTRTLNIGAGITIGSGKTLGVNNTLTFAGTDGITVNFGAGFTIAATRTLAVSNNLTLASDGAAARTLNVAAGGTLQPVAFTGSFNDLADAANIIKSDTTNIYSAGAKQSFFSSSTTAGRRDIPIYGYDPSAGVIGDWDFRSDLNRPRFFTLGGGWKTVATTEDVGGGSSEQTIGNIDGAWTNGKTTLRQTTILSANRSSTMPAANSFPPGATIIYYDNVSAVTSAFGRAFSPAAFDTVNGGPSAYTPFTGNGNVKFATDGANAWTSLDQHVTVSYLQDPTDPSKQAHFVLSGLPTATDLPIDVTNIGNSGTTTARGLNKDVWITLRTDALPGTGTLNDPFDGSTAAKFDTVMRGLVAGQLVHLGPGTFLTTGSASYNATNGYYLPASVKISGAGMYLTTVMQSAYPVAAGGNGHVVLQGRNDTDNAGAEVSDLTVDCNWNAIKTVLTPVGGNYNAKTSGIGLPGNNTKIRRCRIINAYGNANYLTEAFTAVIGVHTVAGTPQNCRGAVIEDCVFESFQGNYGVAAAIFGAYDGNPPYVATTHNGRITGCKTYSWPGYSGAYQALGDGFIIANNEVWGANIGIHIDTGRFDNVVISGNRFSNITAKGIDIVPTLGTSVGSKNLVIQDNVFAMVTNATDSFYGISLSGTTAQILNARVSRNLITLSGSGGLGGGGIKADTVTGLILDSNQLASVLPNSFISVTNFSAQDNLTEIAGVTPYDIPLSKPVNIIAKKANTTNRTSTTTRTNDPDLVLTLLPNTTYRVELRGFITDLTGTNGLNYALYSTQAVSGFIVQNYSVDAGAATQKASSIAAITGDLLVQNLATPFNHVLNVVGIITTGASGTVLSLQWAQRVSSATATQVFDKSYLIATRTDQ